MGWIALICLFLLICLIPSEVWGFLLYLGTLALVACVGYFAFIMWVIG